MGMCCCCQNAPRGELEKHGFPTQVYSPKDKRQLKLVMSVHLVFRFNKIMFLTFQLIFKIIEK